MRAGGRVRRGVAEGGRHQGCRGFGRAAVGRLALADHHAAADLTVVGLDAALSPAALTGDPEEISMLLASPAPNLSSP